MERLDPRVLNCTQKQQHVHAPAAAALDQHSPYQGSQAHQQALSCLAKPHQASPHQASPNQAGLFQASLYQQLQLDNAVMDSYTAKHDSLRMISNAMAGCSADRLCSPGRLRHQGNSVQSHADASLQKQPSYKKQRAVYIAGSAALPAPHAGHPIPLLPKVLHSLEHPVLYNMVKCDIYDGDTRQVDIMVKYDTLSC